jgi:hypothetical protein
MGRKTPLNETVLSLLMIATLSLSGLAADRAPARSWQV